MTVHVKDVFSERHHSVIGSVMPGGRGWGAFLEVGGDCLGTCPFRSSCNGYGPSGKLCSDDWASTGSKPIVWMVLKHVFDNFDYYNRGDLDKGAVAPVVAEIVELLDFPFDETLSPAEARAIVKVRLRQAEFKANLFSLWQGCSIRGVKVNANFLVASHIRPWSKSTDADKVSKYNGFLLPVNYDYLFDRHLVSFSDDGLMLLLHDSEMFLSLYRVLGIDERARLKKVHPENIPYLTEHRGIFLAVKERMSNKRFQGDGPRAVRLARP
jgi:hypothetical protein